MTTLSVRDIAARHLGRTGDLSLDADVYGYVHRDESDRLFGALRTSDVLPGYGTADAPTTRSLRQHLETVSGPSVDLVMFLVEHEPDFSGAVTREQVAKLQFAVQVARDLYVQVGLGIRRVEWGRIPVALAGGHADITSVIGAATLTRNFTGRDGAIDVFVVQTMNLTAGRSPRNGPCNKHAVIPTFLAMTGCVIQVDGTDTANPSQPLYQGLTLAHEIGHYLGLGHEQDEDNVMCGGPRCDATLGRRELSGSQGTTMRSHCMVLSGG